MIEKPLPGLYNLDDGTDSTFSRLVVFNDNGATWADREVRITRLVHQEFYPAKDASSAGVKLFDRESERLTFILPLEFTHDV